MGTRTRGKPTFRRSWVRPRAFRVGSAIQPYPHKGVTVAAVYAFGVNAALTPQTEYLEVEDDPSGGPLD